MYQTCQLLILLFGQTFMPNGSFIEVTLHQGNFVQVIITSRDFCPSDIGPSKILSKKLHQTEVRLCKICQNIANCSSDIWRFKA